LKKTQKLSAQQKTIFEEAEESKMISGAAVPVHGVNGELSGIAVSSKEKGAELNHKTLRKLVAYTNQFHLAYTDQNQENHEINQIILSEREKEILLYAAEGKSDFVIAEILGISYSTVRYHMNNAFTKLDANERTFAIIKAIRLGLITPMFVFQENKKN
jgi:DNA-binding CsgD family transcriptional regulator